jgi:3D (Asp-Asp-Asp) domain-containing protein
MIGGIQLMSSRTACKITARTVRLAVVLLIMIAGWEPFYMQANTRSVCSPNDVSDGHTADARAGMTTEEESSPTSQDQELVEAEQMNPDESSDPPAEAIDAARSAKVYTVVATGYYAGVESTGKHPGHPQYGITYSGVRARRGVISTIAADLSIFPIGTLLYIPGYGYGVVADIGSAVKGNVIDLYFQTKEEIYEQWGKRTVEVIVIEEGDGHLDEKRISELEQLFRNKPTPPSAL